MPTNGYQTALEHATHEISEINAEITAIHLQLEKLADRKDLIEKLVEMLKQVATPSDPVETPAVSADALASEAQAAESQSSEAQAAEAPAPEAAANEGQTHDVPEPEVVAYIVAAAAPYSNGAAVFEVPDSEVEVEELDEYAESEMPEAATRNAAAAERNGHSIGHDLVAQLAHHFWTERGYEHGLHEQDWLRAELVLSEAAP
jgi:hypothetical protein